MPGDRLFDTADPALRDLWDRVLALQTDILFPREVAVFRASAAWLRARTVLDVGTGNGDWLARLAAAFPDRSYRGVDPSPDLVRLARERHGGERLTFAVADWRDVEGPADFVILRMVLQHLPDHDVLVHTLAARLAPGGSILVVDNDPGAARTWPETPLTTAAFAAIARAQRRKHGGDPDVLGQFRRAVGACRDLSLVSDVGVVVPSLDPGNEERLREQTRAALRLFQASGEVGVDFDAALAEWEEWCDEPLTYQQIGLRFLRAART